MLSPVLSGSMGLLGGLFLLGGVPAPAAAMNLTLAQEYAGQTFFDNFVYNVRALFPSISAAAARASLGDLEPSSRPQHAPDLEKAPS